MWRSPLQTGDPRKRRRQVQYCHREAESASGPSSVEELVLGGFAQLQREEEGVVRVHAVVRDGAPADG